MESVGDPQLLTGKTAADCLRKAPIQRGWDNSPEPQNWMIVGSGRKLEAVNQIADRLTTSAEEEWTKWEDMISYELVHFLRKTKFFRYQCPSCHSAI
jgi:hypothetical protein